MGSRPLGFIDALRGYAIALVIASHSFPLINDLPWTVKRFSNLGFFGVQLFFLVSCITLARSWRQRELVARPGLRDFILRRVFRIAPAYFIAAIGYLWILPSGAIDVDRVATFMTFTNGWSPAQMPTVPGAWVGVPGGWSIEAEFAFYALFPVLIMVLRGPWRALAALGVSLPLAGLADQCGSWFYTPAYGAVATDQFLYYWLPNQLPVFLCGLVTYECLARLSPGGRWQEIGRRAARWSVATLGASVLLFASLAFTEWPRLAVPEWGFVSSPLIAAVAFGAITAAVALRPIPLVVNAAVIRLGQASFSAYLLHFALIAALERLLPGAVLAATGITAVVLSALLYLLILGATAVVSQVSYRVIELPAIRMGQRINAAMDASPHRADGRSRRTAIMGARQPWPRKP